MELIHAKETALDFMEQFGLLERGWTFEWHNKKRAYGSCNWKKKKIYLSEFLLPHMQYKDIKDTILHEIAHALDSEKRGYSSHDNTWKSVARKVGADPKSCHEKVDLPKSEFNWLHVCPKCNRWWGLYKRPRATYTCNECKEILITKKVEKGL